MNIETNYKNITISGDIGTGTTTLSKKLAQKLNWEHLNAGDYFRQWHKDHNIPLENTGQIPEEVDRELDYSYQDLMRTQSNTIFESHLAGWLAKDFPETLKVLLTCDFDEAMKRVSQRENISVEEAAELSKKRGIALHNIKFKKLYGVENCFDPEYFSLVIDTTKIPPDQVLQTVLKSLQTK